MEHKKNRKLRTAYHNYLAKDRNERNIDFQNYEEYAEE